MTETVQLGCGSVVILITKAYNTTATFSLTSHLHIRYQYCGLQQNVNYDAYNYEVYIIVVLNTILVAYPVWQQ